MKMAFEQATIKIEKEKEFGELRRAVQEALSPERVKGFLKKLRRGKIRVRDFDSVLLCHVLEATTGRTDLNARRLYGSLTVTDQAQMKEFYLSKIEEVGPELRAKYQKIYQYY
jgi:hypothetical protein